MGAEEKKECDGDTDCGNESCQRCCPHDEFDHYVCILCGYEKCPGEDIDAAEYHYDQER